MDVYYAVATVVEGGEIAVALHPVKAMVDVMVDRTGDYFHWGIFPHDEVFVDIRSSVSLSLGLVGNLLASHLELLDKYFGEGGEE